jgi:hypothetical protein
MPNVPADAITLVSPWAQGNLNSRIKARSDSVRNRTAVFHQSCTLKCAGCVAHDVRDVAWEMHDRTRESTS